MISPGFNTFSSLPNGEEPGRLNLQWNRHHSAFRPCCRRPPSTTPSLDTIAFTVRKMVFQMSGAHHSKIIDSSWSVSFPNPKPKFLLLRGRGCLNNLSILMSLLSTRYLVTYSWFPDMATNRNPPPHPTMTRHVDPCCHRTLELCCYWCLP